MPTDNTFAEFLRRIRAGDDEAAAELVRRFEPVIRREVRLRLSDPALFGLFDSGDFCQSVLLSFFVRASLGQYELNRPEDLRNLLVRMARNKVADRLRQLRRQPADGRRERAASVEGMELAEREPGPERVAAARDLLRAVLTGLPEPERRLAELRMAGHTWPQIAAAVGAGADACRKQLTRALNHVLEQLGLENELGV
jgi:RNA polymerase sigma-70 factor (ECF subfamily)